MAIDLDGSSQYYTIPDSSALNFPAGAWCIGVLFRFTDNSGTAVQCIVTHDGINSANSCNILLNEASGSSPNRIRCVYRDAVTSYSITPTATIGTLYVGIPLWIFFQNNVAASQVQVYTCQQGRAAIQEGTIANTSILGVDAGTHYLGARNTLGSDSFLLGQLFAYFKGDFNLTPAEMQAIANGVPVDRIAKPTLYLNFLTPEPVIRNRVPGNTLVANRISQPKLAAVNSPIHRLNPPFFLFPNSLILGDAGSAAVVASASDALPIFDVGTGLVTAVGSDGQPITDTSAGQVTITGTDAQPVIDAGTSTVTIEGVDVQPLIDTETGAVVIAGQDTRPIFDVAYGDVLIIALDTDPLADTTAGEIVIVGQNAEPLLDVGTGEVVIIGGDVDPLALAGVGDVMIAGYDIEPLVNVGYGEVVVTGYNVSADDTLSDDAGTAAVVVSASDAQPFVDVGFAQAVIAAYSPSPIFDTGTAAVVISAYDGSPLPSVTFAETVITGYTVQPITDAGYAQVIITAYDTIDDEILSANAGYASVVITAYNAGILITPTKRILQIKPHSSRVLLVKPRSRVLSVKPSNRILEVE